MHPRQSAVVLRAAECYGVRRAVVRTQQVVDERVDLGTSASSVMSGAYSHVVTGVLGASQPDLFYARQQMALSLGTHIVIACLGMAFPFIVVLAEWRGNRTGDPVYTALARRWAKAMGVLFAVGAVSGTILSFEFGILWPRWMGRFGAVMGLAVRDRGLRVLPRGDLHRDLPLRLGPAAGACTRVSASRSASPASRRRSSWSRPTVG